MPPLSWHYVCRIYSDGVLLYVGETKNVFSRLGGHSTNQPWWGDVTDVEVTGYNERLDAVAAEKEIVQSLRPKYNINPGVGGLLSASGRG